MAGRPNKKRKRPLAEGVPRPPKRVKRTPWEPAPRTVRRTALLVGLLAPVLIVGLAAVGSNPDYQAPCAILAVFVLMAALIGTLLVRATGWVLWPAVALGLLMLALPEHALRAQLIGHRGVRTEVVVTAAHSSKSRYGTVSWSCHIRRADGQPLPHGTFSGAGCSSNLSVGQSVPVIVDPSGWVPPVGIGEDTTFSGATLYAVPGFAVLWAALVLGAGRRTLRERKA
ncbi:hypothetical protein [Streptomyces sp. Y1]|uniref:Uncharacterized protein n=1 Tax=Streptomyces sp. Y1 TaxID=3238634 RepID=A0AB39TWZ7_9ACTN